MVNYWQVDICGVIFKLEEKCHSQKKDSIYSNFISPHDFLGETY